MAARSLRGTGSSTTSSTFNFDYHSPDAASVEATCKFLLQELPAAAEALGPTVAAAALPDSASIQSGPEAAAEPAAAEISEVKAGGEIESESGDPTE